MTARCGLADCPVLAAPPAGLRTQLLGEGSRFHRGHKIAHDPASLVPGSGETRFAPLAGTAHIYVATTAFAALLESALHSTAGVAPLVYIAELASWAASKVTLTQPVRFIDLRDGELERLGIARGRLVSTSPTHYPCTRNLAAQLQGRVIGGQQAHGLLWNSRQAELTASALDHRPALRDMVDAHPSRVAVLWPPPTGPAPLVQNDLDIVESLGAPLDGDGGRTLMTSQRCSASPRCDARANFSIPLIVVSVVKSTRGLRPGAGHGQTGRRSRWRRHRHRAGPPRRATNLPDWRPARSPLPRRARR